jgi:V-type H+-transporting ATPase 16kDa proteolipid subunit
VQDQRIRAQPKVIESIILIDM